MNQLVKGCQLAIHSAVILVNENQELRVANQKQWQKRLKIWLYIVTEGSLINAEDIYCMQMTKRVGEVILESLFTSVWTCASLKCNLCSLYEHTACTCSTRYLATEP